MPSHDYTQTHADEGKDPSEYHYTERRAEVLDLIERAGSPKRLNVSDLADRYDVTRRTIYHDFDALSDFIEETLGTRAQLRTQALFERVLDNLLDEGKDREAWRTAMEWNEWLAERGAIDRAPKKSEVDATVTSVDGDSTDSYEVVPAEDVDLEAVEAAGLASGGDPTNGDPTNGDGADEG